jgi:L-malate glycosyltransferase
VPSLQTKSTAFWNSIQPVDPTQLPTPALVGKLKGTVVGSVGRFRDKKGLEYLLDACAEVSRDRELTLLLVGDFADRERSYWEREVENSGISDRVIITGMLERTQALAYLPYMNVFAVPSLHDGCPNALLEAMMAGCPVVGTNVDAIGEILEDGQDSLVVQPGSASELAEAIRWLARSPQLGQQLGLAAQAKVLKELAPAVEQENWRKVYQRVLGASSVVQFATA